MSLINQVLNDLDKRGVNVTQGDAALRPVPLRRRSNRLSYVLAACALLVLAAVLLWYPGREKPPVAVREPVAAAKPQYELVPGIAESSVAAEATAAAAPAVVPESPKIVESGPPPARRPLASKRIEAAEPQEAPLAETMPVKVVTPQQRADGEFSLANQAVQEGRIEDALAGYRKALLADPHHKEARRAWVALLLELRRNEEAERTLQLGLQRDPHDASFAMLLARLQVERAALPEAVQTLQKNLSDADELPDYHAFYAALLQRQERHQDAVSQFQIALQVSPGNGVWWMGAAISMQALQRNDEARAAYRRALETGSLNAELQGFVKNKLAELGN